MQRDSENRQVTGGKASDTPNSAIRHDELQVCACIYPTQKNPLKSKIFKFMDPE